MDKEKRFNVEEHTTLAGRVIDVFPISHRYIHNLEQQVKKQQEVIDKVRNNLEKDISVIKTVKMSNKELVSRLEQTNRILKEVSE